MCDLTVIKRNGGCYIDSREVAEVIGKAHCHLLRDIRGYAQIIESGGLSKIGLSDFFIESSYLNGQNKEMPCFLVSKLGCELIGNKLTGEKGVLFTALYVAKFNAMEAAERDSAKPLQAPRLGEYNAAARIIVRAMTNAGARSEQIIGFLRELYEPLGFTVENVMPAAAGDSDDTRRWYTAKEIALMHGICSRNGNPHYHAVAAILSDHIELDVSHMFVVNDDYGDYCGARILYDGYAAHAVEDWLDDNGYPCEVCGNGRIYHVLYDFQI